MMYLHIWSNFEIFFRREGVELFRNCQSPTYNDHEINFQIRFDELQLEFVVDRHRPMACIEGHWQDFVPISYSCSRDEERESQRVKSHKALSIWTFYFTFPLLVFFFLFFSPSSVVVVVSLLLFRHVI